MKNVFVALILLLTTTSYGQINKGAIFIGGSLNLNFSKNDSDLPAIISLGNQKSISSSLHPMAGVFLSENWQIGGGFEYAHSSYRYDYSYYVGGDLMESWQKQKSNLYSIDIFVTRYIHIKNAFYFNISCNLNAGVGNVNYYSPGLEDQTYDQSAIGMKLSPGLTYFVSNRWAIAASMGELYAKHQTIKNSDFDQDAKTTTAGFSLKANTFSIGVQYYLNNSARE